MDRSNEGMGRWGNKAFSRVSWLPLLAAAGLTLCGGVTPRLLATPEFSTVLSGAGLLNCVGAENGIFSATPVNRSLVCNGTTPAGQGETVTETSLLQARANFVSLGSYIDYTITTSSGVSVSNLGMSATARGSDEITVSGGTGDGILRVTLALRGLPVIQQGQLAVGVFWGFSWTGSVGVNGFSPGDLTADIPFTYGVPFLFSRILSVSVTGNVWAGDTFRAFGDYFGSAELMPFEVLDLSLNPVAGASVASASFTYAVADAGGSTAVPEPGTPMALLTGAGTLAMLARLRRSGRRQQAPGS